MRNIQSAAIKTSLIVLLLANIGYASAQDSLLLARQAAHKSREYISFDAQPLFRTGTTIVRATDRDVMKKLNTPGFAVGVDYQRVSLSGLTFAGGIHFRMIPVAYKFDVNYNELASGGPSTSNFGSKNSNLINGHFYFPIQAGYAFSKKIGNWAPSVLGGVSISSVQSSHLSSGSYYWDNANVRHPVQEISVYYSELHPWLTYTLNARASKTLRRGNQIFFGFNFNYSPVIYNQGDYAYYPESGQQTGTFSDTGSYIALQFGFSFVRKYQEPQPYRR
ncbi:hypothetical protein [Daejeonella lutea]|uniref:Outer membrane protein beta-barrel domain-containing protein n=1 Tax=Daejeonella lutea TaxID=572036 RepID=A0A1T5B2H3_9SPHI|nr:hypothetical protein [Daejeonella lutea]SKB41414.1 hypothetical protein SAMN05661099_1222 [Daejeonella lutea]